MIKNRLWVVEARMGREQYEDTTFEWIPCTFTKLPFADENYFAAHEKKRDLLWDLQDRVGKKTWTVKDFRVREYVQK